MVDATVADAARGRPLADCGRSGGLQGRSAAVCGRDAEERRWSEYQRRADADSGTVRAPARLLVLIFVTPPVRLPRNPRNPVSKGNHGFQSQSAARSSPLSDFCHADVVAKPRIRAWRSVDWTPQGPAKAHLQVAGRPGSVLVLGSQRRRRRRGSGLRPRRPKAAPRRGVSVGPGRASRTASRRQEFASGRPARSTRPGSRRSNSCGATSSRAALDQRRPFRRRLRCPDRGRKPAHRRALSCLPTAAAARKGKGRAPTGFDELEGSRRAVLVVQGGRDRSGCRRGAWSGWSHAFTATTACAGTRRASAAPPCVMAAQRDRPDRARLSDTAPPSAAARPLLVVDAPSMLFRAFYALPESIKGAEAARTAVNALLGAANLILREVEQHEPRAVVLCFGPDAAAYRVELYPATTPSARRCPTSSCPSGPTRGAFFEAFGWTVDRPRLARGRRPDRLLARGRRRPAGGRC